MWNLEGHAIDGLEIAEVAVEVVDFEGGHGGENAEILKR
jgi:hypothetical protein